MQENYVYYVIALKKNKIKETDEARLVLKKMLEYFNLEMPDICISKDGKPYFKNSNIYFNYSHTKNYIACALSLQEVGIDIEELSRKINDKVASKYLDGVKDNNKRLEIWVRKEAYSKLKGLGLKINFQKIKLDDLKCFNKKIKNEKYICSIYCENVSIIEKMD